MLAALNLHIVAQYSALRIIESLAEGTVIWAFAAILLRFAPRQNAGTRFAIWFSALLAIGFAPIVTGIWSSHLPTSGAKILTPAITVPDSWAIYLFAAWAILAVWFLLGVGRALWHIRALKKNCTEIDVQSLDGVLQQVLRSAGNSRNVRLCVSEQVRIPTAIGLIRPVIVIPRWVIEELMTAELKQILIHEVAHLRRRDDWTNFIQQTVKSVFFFHPAVWWIERQASLEREVACDDAVLVEIENPRAYAECLTHLAERSFARRSLALAQAVLGRVRQTSMRVAKILDGNRPKGMRTWKPAVSLVAGFALMFSVGASRFQRLIAFQDDSQPQTARGYSEAPKLERNLSPGFVHNAVLQTGPAVAPTQHKFVGTQSKDAVHQHPKSVRRVVQPKMDSMIHLASSKNAVAPVHETVFLFVEETGPSAEPDEFSGIQMWRVTVLRYVVEPTSSTTPRKQI